ncbi:MAG TPA: DUF3037 domain-containing protein [Terriglobales bacterium]|nr:DUF3037 domain-containing protein [Terriglobales bacterium]
MPHLKQCEFFLLRYVPDVVKDEFVNIGVLLLSPDENFAQVRFMRDWSRVRCLDPGVDLESLQGIEADIQDQFRAATQSPADSIARLRETLSNSLQITNSKPLLSESPQQELQRLAGAYLERAHAGRTAKTSARQKLVVQMQGAFEVEGVWNAMNKRIAVSRYTRPGDPLRIDCGYRPNGVIRLFHALAIPTEPDSAKILAFTFPLLAEGIQRLDNAKTDLTALVEDDLDRSESATGFALDTLQRSSIRIAPVSELPDLAKRGRFEMRL